MIDLKEIYDKGWWVKVSPLARINKECWVCSIYKKGKVSWITEECEDFDSPQEAYDWAKEKIKELKK
tara:strand:+ start:244 stop:444 length:201 start_codon:yes stop_codon:yes gene_type:complete